MKVVVLAEGAAELTGGHRWLLRPGDSLREDVLGPAHILVQRALSAITGQPEASIHLQEPNRVKGRLAKGSDLLVQRRLRRLLQWPLPERRPDLAVVLVDCDGHGERARTLERFVDGLRVRTVIGVAVQEFEAWLIGDEAAVRQVLSIDLPGQPGPETLPPREAKRRLAEWVSAAQADARKIRCSLARVADLDALGRLPSFARFRSQLSAG